MIGNKTKAGQVFEYQMFTDPDDPKTTWHLKRAYLTRQEQLGADIRRNDKNPDGLTPDKLGEERARILKEYILEHSDKLTDVAPEIAELKMPEEQEKLLDLMEAHFDTQDLDELANAVSYGPAKMEAIFGRARAALAEETERKNA